MSSPDEAAAPDVGVGPWVGAWPDDDRLDPGLLRDGDRRNVVDRYRYWTQAAIIADLDTRRQDFHVAIENWRHDFNIGSVVRTANAFNAAAFHIVGRRRWNRRGAMVTDRYQHELHHPTVSDLVDWAGRMPLIGIDNLPGSIPLEAYDLPRACVLVFGQEGPGLSPQMRAACEVVLHIEQFGSTRSLNAGAAAAIAMHAWVRRHVFGQAVDELTSRPSSGWSDPAPPTDERNDTMTEYLLLLPGSDAKWASATPEDRDRVHAAHTQFARLLEERGHKMTGGAALTSSPEAQVVRGRLDDVTVTEGPYAESVEQVSGFYTVATDDLDDLLKICGLLSATGFHDVEVRAFQPLDMG